MKQTAVTSAPLNGTLAANASRAADSVARASATLNAAPPPANAPDTATLTAERDILHKQINAALCAMRGGEDAHIAAQQAERKLRVKKPMFSEHVREKLMVCANVQNLQLHLLFS